MPQEVVKYLFFVCVNLRSHCNACCDFRAKKKVDILIMNIFTLPPKNQRTKISVLCKLNHIDTTDILVWRTAVLIFVYLKLFWPF